MADVTIEVVVMDDEDTRVWIGAVVRANVFVQLQTHGGLARAFGTKDDRRGRVSGTAKDFVPGRMKSAVDTVLLEDCIGLRVLFSERIARKVMMLQEILHVH